MPRNRFQLIQRYLHCNDSNAAGTNEDRLYRHHTSRKAPAEHLHLLQQNVPQKWTPGRLDGKLKNHKLVHILLTENYKTPTRKCRVCVLSALCSVCVLSVVFLCIQKAATHDITRCNITEGMF